MTLFEHIQKSTNCAGEDAHRELLMLGISPVWRGVVRLLPRLPASNSWFVERRLIQECLHARSLEQVSSAVERFHYRGLCQVPFMRRCLRLRVSGRRLMRLAAQVLPRSLEEAGLPGPLLESGWGGRLVVRDMGDQTEASLFNRFQLDRAAGPSDPVYQPFVVPPQRILPRRQVDRIRLDP